MLNVKERANQLFAELKDKNLLEPYCQIEEHSNKFTAKYIKGLTPVGIGKFVLEFHTILFDYYQNLGYSVQNTQGYCTSKISVLFDWGEAYISRLKKIAKASEYIQDKVEGNLLSLNSADTLMRLIKKHPELSEEYVVEDILKNHKFRDKYHKISYTMVEKWFQAYKSKIINDDDIVRFMLQLKKDLSKINFDNLTEIDKKKVVRLYKKLTKK